MAALPAMYAPRPRRQCARTLCCTNTIKGGRGDSQAPDTLPVLPPAALQHSLPTQPPLSRAYLLPGCPHADRRAVLPLVPSPGCAIVCCAALCLAVLYCAVPCRAVAYVQGMTALALATLAYPVQAGDTVLVHAAAGGVGQMLVQLAKAAGGGGEVGGEAAAQTGSSEVGWSGHGRQPGVSAARLVWGTGGAMGQRQWVPRIKAHTLLGRPQIPDFRF